MSKFTPPYECNTFLSSYLDGGNDDLPFSWQQFPKNSLSPAKNNRLESRGLGKDRKPLDKLNQSYIKNASPNYKQQRKWFVAGLSRACETLLGRTVIDIEFPGGEQRSACRLYLDDDSSVIATRRGDTGRTLLEQKVLEQLAPFTHNIPKIKGFNGAVLIQEDLQGIRLSEAIKKSSEKKYEILMGKSLDSLIDIHQASEQAGLDQAVPLLGYNNKWLNDLIEQPAVIGNYLEIECPYPPVDEIFDLLTVMRPRFIKWDARPGNAMVGSDGEVSWFDWEHCCARNRLDDVVWLLCDEIVPYHPEAENRLIHNYLSYFADGYDLEMAYAYLRIFGILHMSIRLGGILSEKGSRRWMSASNSDFNLAEDPLIQAQRLCKRASDWTRESICPRSISDWFMHISSRLKEF